MALATRRVVRDRVSDYLSASDSEASFAIGIASIFDFAGALRPHVQVHFPNTDEGADARALEEDWRSVGRSIWMAVTREGDDVTSVRQ